MIRRPLLLAALFAAACGTNPANVPVGEFVAPAGLAATGAGDRDVLFIANSGKDGLRALQFCNKALPDGGVDPTDTCPPNENGQFVPAPIRVFPATVETGDRPIRVAGVRLSRSDGSSAGVGLAVGGDSTVAVVDARSLVEAQNVPGAVPKEVQHLDVGAAGIDVVAVNPIDADLDLEAAAPAGATVTAFVATQNEIVVLDVGLGADGFAQLPSIRARCTLAPVVATKLAIVPGSADQVYVADGAGDGVVSIATSSIPAGGGPCAIDRISAGNRTVRSVAISPKWYETVTDSSGNQTTLEHPAGELLMMVVNPAATAQVGQDLDPGGVLIARTGLFGGPKGVAPIPPFPFSDATSEPMQPLALGSSGPPAVSTAGLMREVAFMRAVKPRASPRAPDLKTCTSAPCTPLYVGTPSNAPSHLYDLLAVVSATDGATYFVDVLNRRFVNSNLYLTGSDASLAPSVSAPLFSPAVGAQPALNIDPASMEPGVTHTTFWRAIWHSPIPGLDRRSGILTPTGTGTLKLTVPGVDFTTWQNDAAIQLAPGDVVSFGAYQTAPSDGSADCQALVASETPYRFELPILTVNADSLEVPELADTPDTRGFHLGSCTAVGVVTEVRTGGTRPWLVFEASSVQGRVQPDGSFVAHQRRFDYPRSAYSAGGASTPPQAASVNDVALRFSITGPDPAVPRSGFSWTTASSQAPVLFADALAPGGFATAVYPYTSLKTQALVFTSITGSNELLQADPAVLQSNLATGLLAYR